MNYILIIRLLPFFYLLKAVKNQLFCFLILLTVSFLTVLVNRQEESKNQFFGEVQFPEMR